MEELLYKEKVLSMIEAVYNKHYYHIAKRFEEEVVKDLLTSLKEKFKRQWTDENSDSYLHEMYLNFETRIKGLKSCKDKVEKYSKQHNNDFVANRIALEQIEEDYFKIGIEEHGDLGETFKIDRFYYFVNDFVGVRLLVDYRDEVESIAKFVKAAINQREGCFCNYPDDHHVFSDQNYLKKDRGDGYLAYHFYAAIPVTVDIFGYTKLVVCEFQIKTELQSAWANKSHSLLYKEAGLIRQERKPTASDPTRFDKEDMKITARDTDSIDMRFVNYRDRRIEELKKDS